MPSLGPTMYAPRCSSSASATTLCCHRFMEFAPDPTLANRISMFPHVSNTSLVEVFFYNQRVTQHLVPFLFVVMISSTLLARLATRFWNMAVGICSLSLKRRQQGQALLLGEKACGAVGISVHSKGVKCERGQSSAQATGVFPHQNCKEFLSGT